MRPGSRSKKRHAISTPWTPEQILALAPDAGSARSGRDLAHARKWVAGSLGRSGAAAWGHCQGSGKDPYQTQIDLSEPAFRCTCPSRKFPCKHGLGLFLLLASQPTELPESAPPAWVSEWLEGRARKARQRAEKEARKAEGGPAVADPAAQAKRAAQRQAKVAAGLQDLELWLRDLVRNGLAAAQSQPYSFWETPAARMVDAQAPGVGRLLREMAGLPSTGEGWEERLLERLGRLHLLIEGFKRLDALPPETQAEVRGMIGWTQSQEELLGEPGVRDHWLVVGQRMEEEERLRVLRTWLLGRETGRRALVLSFAAFGQPLDRSLLPGSCVEADLVFYPGSYPLRALVKTRHAPATQAESLPGYATVEAAVQAYAAALARAPWLEAFPVPLQAVVPVPWNGGWAARDEAGHVLPVPSRFDRGWHMRALSGGHPLALFGEWNGDFLTPLSAWVEGRFHPLSRQSE
jgi:hypothetical protein